MSDSKESTAESESRTGPQSQPSVQLKSSMLRPSLFGSNLKPVDSSKPSIIEDTKNNPFLKDDVDDGPSEETAKQEENKAVEKEDPLSALKKNGLPKSNLLTTVKNSIAETSGFVFGQNVHERVVGETVQNASKPSEISSDTDLPKTDSTPSTSSNLLFSEAIQSSKPNQAAVSKENDNKSLTEIAREYEESRAQKRKYEEVETFTGEENEVNVIDLNCKLFAFINRNWEERGRGTLRLNDSKDGKNCSRVVFRTSGNLRLLVNTKVWPGMIAERPSQKSLRLTAMDNTGQIKVFLVMSRPDDISTLHKALIQRIDAQKKQESGSKPKQNDVDDPDISIVVNENSADEPSPKKVAVELN